MRNLITLMILQFALCSGTFATEDSDLFSGEITLNTIVELHVGKKFTLSKMQQAQNESGCTVLVKLTLNKSTIIEWLEKYEQEFTINIDGKAQLTLICQEKVPQWHVPN